MAASVVKSCLVLELEIIYEICQHTVPTLSSGYELVYIIEIQLSFLFGIT